MNPQKDKAAQFLESYEEALHSFALPQRISGQYVLLNCIKHSKEKEIYLLSDRQDHFYILKREKNNQTTQIRQEHQIFAILEQADAQLPIPECIDYWEETDWCYLLRTYIEGDSLMAYSDGHPCLANEVIMELFSGICRIIKMLHDRKPPIIHRDIKPENFILQKGTNTLFLVDFDTARQYIPEKTRDTHMLGTPEIAAPEQFGFYQSDVRTDIYGIGKTMLYLLSGTTSEEGLQDKSIPLGLRKIIGHAVAFSPEKRYPNVSALQKDIEKYKKKFSHAFLFRRLASGMLIFALGLGIGFMGGKYYQAERPGAAELLAEANSSGEEESPSTEDSSAVADSSSEADSPATPEKASLSGEEAGQSQKKQNSTDSLLSISGAKQVDLWKYQEQLDAIILSYYNGDFNSMTAQLEELVNDLYADNAIMQVPGEDYSTYKTLPPDFWQVNDLATIRMRLAYREQILRTKLGTYQDYEKNIISVFDSSLSLINKDGLPSALYLYATLPVGERNGQYGFALSDILCDVCTAFDMADGFTTPE